MIKRRIQANKAFKLVTRIDTKEFQKDEIALVKFENELQFTELLGFNLFKESHKKVPVTGRHNIPILGRNPKPIVTDEVNVIDKTPIENKVEGENVSTSEPINEGLVSKYVCSECAKSFASQRGLSMHSRVHTKPKTDTDKDDDDDKDTDTVTSADSATEVIPVRNCSNCNNLMEITGESNIPGTGKAIEYECPMCQEKESVMV